MQDNNSLKKAINSYKNNWNFINPYWPLILMIIYVGVQFLLYNLVGYSGLRITDAITIKRAMHSIESIVSLSGISVIVALIHIVLSVGIVYICVCIIPADKKHNNIRLAGIFVIVGSVFKAIVAIVNMGGTLNIAVGESLVLPMPTCADIYLFGGIIAILVILSRRYSNQEIEEIIYRWRTRKK